MNFMEKYKKEMAEYDKMEKDFIDDDLIWKQLNNAENPTKEQVRAVLKKADNCVRLEPEETAILIQNKDPETIQEMYDLAYKLKHEVYADRLVLFAPLYCSDECVNKCKYCGFRGDNGVMKRKTLTQAEVAEEVKAMINEGQKRTILVFGESPNSDVNYMVDTLRTTYSTKTDKGEIRRANINAAPLSVEEYRKLKKEGIGTIQVFQETYHHETYKYMHPQDTIKGHYRWRLYCMDRAYEAGCDDMGLGVLFGLYDWRFEVMGLLYHTIHLEKKFNGVGPHTISFPRVTLANSTPLSQHLKYKVSDEDFKKLVAIIRLSVPYTGMICTAREPKAIRDQVIKLGVSQMDAGTRIGVGAYAKSKVANQLNDAEQFTINDEISLDGCLKSICEIGEIPSFCTACYRAGRTGEEFMKFAKTQFIHNFCMPNAILTFKEYIVDYASKETAEIGNKVIEKYLKQLEGTEFYTKIIDGLKQIENGKRDVRF